MTKTKFEVMEICNEVDIPVGPILSMKEIAEEPVAAQDRHGGRGRSSDARQISDRRQSDQAVRLDLRGDSVRRCLGEHTDEILKDVLGFQAKDIAEIKNSGALSAPKKEEKAA